MSKTASEPVAELDREPADYTLYVEYVRGFDELPVLHDVVRSPPRRMPPPSFVRGERRSLRREERPDGYSQRETAWAEIEDCYREYAAPAAARPKRKKARKSTPKKGSRSRKRAAA
jgi:hypothetical protein